MDQPYLDPAQSADLVELGDGVSSRSRRSSRMSISTKKLEQVNNSGGFDAQATFAKSPRHDIFDSFTAESLLSTKRGDLDASRLRE